MLTVKPITCKSPDARRVHSLMNRAFPPNERVPLHLLFDGGRRGAELLGFYEGEQFCGFISLLSWRNITHILYFAMEEELRGQGYGTAALELIHALKKGQRIIADLEAEDASAPNASQRGRRRRFYQRCGYTYSFVSYRWREENYEIFSHGGRISREEFESFWAFFNG